MTIVQMLQQSGLLTLLGMCVVFAFIIIMIASMHLLHAALHALKLDVEEKQAAPQATVSQAAAVSATPAAVQNDAVIAAIAARVHE